MESSIKILLKEANFSDIEFLWYLRNQPSVYQHSINSKPVKWEEHLSWILPILLQIDKKVKLFIVKKKQTPVGQIRFNYESPSKAKISISLSEEFRGKGLAKKALELAVKHIRKDKKLKLLIAVIHKKNIVSQKLFEKLNFQFKRKKGSWLEYNL